MSEVILSLDIGSQSIGWALVSPKEGKILNAGVRVFPEGVDRDKGTEVSKNQKRRIARGMRRQIRRRAIRKRQLRQVLALHGLLPSDPIEQEAFLGNSNPYELRARALDEKLTLHELGRVFQQINQRRGFKSNKKADKARKAEDSKMLAEISALQAEIQAMSRTLGEFLFKHAAKPGEVPLVRIRGKHTRRQMLEDEFDKVWEAQSKHHVGQLTDSFKHDIKRIVFFQRPMYSPASVVGKCELCPRLPRAPKADRRAQLFRLFQEVNNLKILDTDTGLERSLDATERQQLIALLSVKDKLKFDMIRKKMNFLESVQFNLERGDRKELKGLPTEKVMSDKKILGKAWQGLADNDKNKIVAAIIQDNEEKIAEIGRALNLNEEMIAKAQGVNLEEGYASYSLYAIKKLLPFLEQGLPLSSRDNENALVKAGFQRPWDQQVQKTPFLSEPPNVTNPLVRTALFEVRKVVNAIVRDLINRPGHKLVSIHLELTREVRGTAKERARYSREIRETEARRKQIAQVLESRGERATREKILRFQLWEEQGRCCVYSGRPISVDQLISGEVDIDHILPYGQSLDDSQMNKVLAFRGENHEKRNRTPFEWLSAAAPEKYEQVLQRVKRLAYPKHNRFRVQEVKLDEFINRQLSDTSYITSVVHHYLKPLGVDIVCTKGQCTAPLRRLWGMNSILNDQDIKTREDHRHHAVDAIVIALTGRVRLQELARMRRFNFKSQEQDGYFDAYPQPWDGFLDQARQAVQSINVSHKARRNIAGALHEEYFYGPTEVADEFVIRKAVGELTMAMIVNVRDEKIKNIIWNRLKKLGVNIADKKAELPKDWFKGLVLEPNRKKNPNGTPIPILKVRVIRKDQTITQIRPGAFVKPGSVHHACLFQVLGANDKVQKEAVYISTLEAKRRAKEKKSLISKIHPDQPKAKFLMSLSKGEMLVADFKGREQLTVIVQLGSTEQKVFLVSANDARKSNDRVLESKRVNRLRGKKVTVDPIGRIRWAND